MTENDPQIHYRALVARLAHDAEREAAFDALNAAGPAARDAVRAGLRHGHWQVRRWCAIWFDHHADPDSLPALIPLLRDPKSAVRLFAVHSISCDRCKEGEPTLDVVPLLIERVQQDESIRVRRMAVCMLAHQHAHPDLEGFFQQLLDTETDAKLHKHAGFGLLFCRQQREAAAAGG
ncbi:MAG: HEAT repeat domain-containing protein [Myxococcota bacterium]